MIGIILPGCRLASKYNIYFVLKLLFARIPLVSSQCGPIRYLSLVKNELFPLRNDENDIFLIVEQYREKENIYLFDFADQQSFNEFVNLLRPDNFHDREGPSMVELNNFIGKKRFREGTYYKLNKKWVVERNLNMTAIDNSAVVRYQIDLNQESIGSFFNGSAAPPGLLKLPGRGGEELAGILEEYFPVASGNPFDSLVVRYVGQGSWNEFLAEQSPRLVFDIGTIYTAPKAEVAAYMKTRDHAYQSSAPVLVLSHWDVDHYHLLLEAEDATIQAFSRFIFRDIIPNATAYRVYERFFHLNRAAIFPVSAETPDKGRSSKKLKMVAGGPYLRFYNGSRHWNRNLSGIMLSFQTHKLGIVCAADFEYGQLQSGVLGYFKYRHDHYLVVPHHGGEAGKVTYEPLGALKQDAVISVGAKKQYGHPQDSVLNELRRIGFRIVNFRYHFDHYELALH